MQHFEVGKPYSPTRKRWPEGADHNYRGGGHELRIFYPRPTMEEVASIKRGKPEFAFLVRESVIVFLWKFGSEQWSDKPFSIHLVPEEERLLPDPGDETEAQRALLTVLLVDADTGILLAIRAVSLSPEFTRALHDEIREQANRPFPGDAAYDRQIAVLYREYPNSAAMARDARARCIGGR